MNGHEQLYCAFPAPCAVMIMEENMQTGIIKLKNAPSIVSFAAIGGKKEAEGPLGHQFDYIDENDRFGEDTWEKSEAQMQKIALTTALNKKDFASSDIDALFAGDLMNQCTSSA